MDEDTIYYTTASQRISHTHNFFFRSQDAINIFYQPQPITLCHVLGEGFDWISNFDTKAHLCMLLRAIVSW